MQGTDGLSRGDFSAGVMAGQQMLQFVPLHLSAGERSPSRPLGSELGTCYSLSSTESRRLV
jgi:hypothetical protein